jgi:hypothetical protein
MLRTHSLLRAGLLAGAVAALLGAACSTPYPNRYAAPKPNPLDREDPAPDFSLSVTVFNPTATGDAAAALPRPHRPARYIVLPDAILRASVGTGSWTGTFPPETRQLSEAQYRDLWRLTRNSGLLDPDSTARIPTSDRYLPREGRPVAVLDVTTGGRRVSSRVNLDATSPEAGATETVIDRLAELAWIRE